MCGRVFSGGVGRSGAQKPKRLRKFLVLTVAMGTLLCLYIVVLRPPVLVNLHLGSMVHDPGITIFNPIRDRGPEIAAALFLDLLSSRQCQLAISGLAIRERDLESLCEIEGKYPLTRWRLTDRDDKGQVSVLTYAFEFNGGIGESELYTVVTSTNGAKGVQSAGKRSCSMR
jgi:hypothetical protein